MVTPLGSRPGQVLSRIEAGESAAVDCQAFDPTGFGCTRCAPVDNFEPEAVFPDNKTLRMMNRDAQLAVVAAPWATEDARLAIGRDIPPEQVGLYGSTGLASLPIEEFDRLVCQSAGDDGRLDLVRFGREALKRVRPVLSFKILANMPICFVSIFEGLCGPNAVYTPWQGQGARAIQAGIFAVRSGRVRAAVVGGGDSKVNLLGFIALHQHGRFAAWRNGGGGPVPGEGAAFAVLEAESSARARGARIYAAVTACEVRTRTAKQLAEDLTRLGHHAGPAPSAVLAGCDGAQFDQRDEMHWLAAATERAEVLWPKRQVGNLFAASSALQFALAAERARTTDSRVWALCLGQDSEMGLFALEAL
jgi:3-oxoacyl-(acyl-carrier-protein) synthase